VGVDVAGVGQERPGEGVGFVAGAGVGRVQADVAGQGCHDPVGGDLDGVGDQLRLDVEDLLAWVDLGQGQPGRGRLVGLLRAGEVGLGLALLGGEVGEHGVGDGDPVGAGFG